MSSITLSQDDLKAIRDILNAYTYTNKHRVTQGDLHYIRQLAAQLDQHIIDTPAYLANKVGEAINSVKKPVRNTQLVKTHIDNTPAKTVGIIRPPRDIRIGDQVCNPHTRSIFFVENNHPQLSNSYWLRVLTPAEVRCLPKGATVIPLRTGSRAQAWVEHMWEGSVHNKIPDCNLESRYALVSLNGMQAESRKQYDATRDYDAELQSLLRQLDELTQVVHKLRYQIRKEGAAQ